MADNFKLKLIQRYVLLNHPINSYDNYITYDKF